MGTKGLIPSFIHVALDVAVIWERSSIAQETKACCLSNLILKDRAPMKVPMCPSSMKYRHMY